MRGGGGEERGREMSHRDTRARVCAPLTRHSDQQTRRKQLPPNSRGVEEEPTHRTTKVTTQGEEHPYRLDQTTTPKFHHGEP